MLYSHSRQNMPSSFNHWLDWILPIALYLLGIFVIALVVNRLLRAVSNLVIKQASGQGRQAQLREQQTRTLAGVLYGAGSKAVWVVALLMVLDKFKFNIIPAVTVAGRQPCRGLRGAGSGSRCDHGILHRARRSVRRW